MGLLTTGCPLAVEDSYVIRDDEQESDGGAGSGGSGGAGQAGTSGASGGGAAGAGGAPPAPRCDDSKQNADESDVDCGGSTCPARCAVGKTCKVNADCATNTCAAGRCTAVPACDDLQKNGAETDTDCGGPTCPRCRSGQACVLDRDCAGEEASCSSGRCSDED
jgi:hypothetical protein